MNDRRLQTLVYPTIEYLASRGKLLEHFTVNKFGRAPDFDIADGFVDIWDGANDAGISAMNYTFSTTADIDQIVSSSGTDTQQIEVQGLDADYNLIIQTATLSGTNPVTLTTPLIRAFRMINNGSVDLAGDVTLYVNGGSPSVAADVRAIISAENNQTLMSIYTVPAGHSCLMYDWFASGSNVTGGFFGTEGSGTIRLLARPFEKVFQLKHISTIKSNGDTVYKHPYTLPLLFEEKTDLKLQSNTSVNGGSISGGFDLLIYKN